MIIDLIRFLRGKTQDIIAMRDLLSQVLEQLIGEERNEKILDLSVGLCMRKGKFVKCEGLGDLEEVWMHYLKMQEKNGDGDERKEEKDIGKEESVRRVEDVV